MSTTPSKEVSQKLSYLYFYLHDISQEMQSVYGLIQIVEATLSEHVELEAPKFFDMRGEFSVKISKGNPQVIKTMAKISFQTAIINICRLSEAIGHSDMRQLLKKYSPLSLERFEIFIKKYYTKEVKYYRNKYSAHPINRDTDNFLNLKEIFNLIEKILNISSMEKFRLDHFYGFVKEFHHPNITDPNQSITWAIYEMSNELRNNGITLDREKDF
ncbi:integron-associated HEPN domain-containing protein [Acinetobacter sp. ANC 4648]|uniref:integron-associated HEPN domain-containing protein n=1 Tax=Acinetobacter sp. ANC 4648 TaxID=1977875 RepID=UPI000A340906|nr:integron-associated HEPN domain-containing protein [Acinetobacter sp. ANC 4648]OTG82331.1 hypothetical protein B9T27_08835 [Acinetobacter sp. ANC 4648]